MFETLKLSSDLDGDIWLYHSGPVHKAHHHVELEFNLITAGGGLYLLDNRKYQIRKGDLVWLFPGQEHILIKETEQFEMWIGVMKPSSVGRVARSKNFKILLEENPAGHFCRRLEQNQADKLGKLFDEINATREIPRLFNAGLAYALLNAWHLFERAVDVPYHDLHPAVENAARLLRDSVDSQKLVEIAQRAGLSAPRLSRLFKQQIGVPLAEFRSRERLERFFRIYGTGQRVTMITAALEAGFGSYPQFHRVFTRLTGQAPNEYRRRFAAP